MTTTGPATVNGVDVPTLLAMMSEVEEQRDLAAFQFRATSGWVLGTRCRTTIEGFTGAGSEHEHRADHAFDADHPTVLTGADHAPTPTEFLLHALGPCLLAGVATIASVHGIALRSV